MQIRKGRNNTKVKAKVRNQQMDRNGMELNPKLVFNWPFISPIWARTGMKVALFTSRGQEI